MNALLALTVFPGGLTVLALGLCYQWVTRKLVARLQNRVGPPWYQPAADLLKLLFKQTVVPRGVPEIVYAALPLVALASVLAAALYVPLLGQPPAYSFSGDVVVVVYLLTVPALCWGLAGTLTASRFGTQGALRALTQVLAYEAPLLLALLAPVWAAGSWRTADAAAYAETHAVLLTMPLGFLVAILGIAAKLELPPFDAPEAPTELVSGALTEYTGVGLALFRLAKDGALVVSLAFVSALYIGGDLPRYLASTVLLLFALGLLQVLFTRLRIDQTMRLWWRWGVLLVLAQWGITLLIGR